MSTRRRVWCGVAARLKLGDLARSFNADGRVYLTLHLGQEGLVPATQLRRVV